MTEKEQAKEITCAKCFSSCSQLFYCDACAESICNECAIKYGPRHLKLAVCFAHANAIAQACDTVICKLYDQSMQERRAKNRQQMLRDLQTNPSNAFKMPSVPHKKRKREDDDEDENDDEDTDYSHEDEKENSSSTMDKQKTIEIGNRSTDLDEADHDVCGIILHETHIEVLHRENNQILINDIDADDDEVVEGTPPKMPSTQL